MGYDLRANNKKLDDFHFGAFSFPLLLEKCGHLFPTHHGNGYGMCSWIFSEKTKDKRYKRVKYPPELCNDGFKVSSFEAKVMSICATNFCDIQESLTEEHKDFYVRDDFIKLFRKFAEWSKISNGFRIY